MKVIRFDATMDRDGRKTGTYHVRRAPRVHIYDPAFKYRPAHMTDIAQTWREERERRVGNTLLQKEIK